jgi:hypothetical protein
MSKWGKTESKIEAMEVKQEVGTKKFPKSG